MGSTPETGLPGTGWGVPVTGGFKLASALLTACENQHLCREGDVERWGQFVGKGSLF